MITSSSQASFANQPRGDTKTRQPMPAPMPLEPVDPHASGATRRTPSGRAVSVCVFARADSYDTWRNRQQCVTWGAVSLATVSSVLTASLYRPADDDPDRVAKLALASAGAFLAPLVLRFLAPLEMVCWRRADLRDQRSREAAERSAVADLSPRERLVRHLDQANQERRTASGVEKAIAFLKTLQEENPAVLSHADVARSIAAYIGGAASVESPDSFSLLTYHLAELAARGRCDPALVLDQLEGLWSRAMGALAALARRAPEPSRRLRLELQQDMAAAITRTVWRAVDRVLGSEAHEAVDVGWSHLEANAAQMGQRLDFARSVIRLVPSAGAEGADTKKLMRELRAVVGGAHPPRAEGARRLASPRSAQPRAGRHVSIHAPGAAPFAAVPGRVIRTDRQPRMPFGQDPAALSAQADSIRALPAPTPNRASVSMHEAGSPTS